MKVGIAQIAPVFLDRDATLRRVVARVDEAAQRGCKLVCFGEAIVPGYPVWLSRTGGARFDDTEQKQMHSRYLHESVDLEGGDLDVVCEAARRQSIAVVLGVAERAPDRGGHSLFCTAVVVQADGTIAGRHRKLVPTHEEGLIWAQGDGAGLATHEVGPFRVGVLNCWESWMPLARQALYAAGVDLLVVLWPGRQKLTEDVTRFVAQESRSWVVSACGLLREADLPANLPMRRRIAKPNEVLNDGGSCIAAPDGAWHLQPRTLREDLITAELDPARVGQERQNFDPAGHYARPDVLHLRVDRRRLSAAEWIDEGDPAPDAEEDSA